MTQIGVGIGVNKSPIKLPSDKQNVTKKLTNNGEKPNQRKVLNKQFSSNSSEPRQTNDGGDDENSNSFESHSDNDLANKAEKKFSKLSLNKRRGMSVNWGSQSTTAINLPANRCQPGNQKNAKSFAHSFYRNPIRLHGLTSTKLKQSAVSSQPSRTLTPIPSEPELASCRVYPPQPRPESLAIMSEELFHERLKARQSPLLTTIDPTPTATVILNEQLPTSIILDKTPTEEVSHSEPTVIEEEDKEKTEDLIETTESPSPVSQSQLIIPPIVNTLDESSDESWRLLNSNSSLDIPYIDETDFEDLGKAFSRSFFLISFSFQVTFFIVVAFHRIIQTRQFMKKQSSTNLQSSSNVNVNPNRLSIHRLVPKQKIPSTKSLAMNEMRIKHFWNLPYSIVWN